MSVDAVRLQNFMAFKDTDWVELRPITLLFGRNSSGKSALMRALLLLKQSLLPPDDRVFVFSTPFGVDLGGFREMVHGGTERSVVRFHFRCTAVEFEGLLAGSPFPEVKDRATETLQLALGYAAEREGETLSLDRIELTDLEICAIRAEGEESDLLFRAVLLNPEDETVFGERWFVGGILPDSDKPETWKGFDCKARRGFLNVSFVQPRSEVPVGYPLLTHIFGKLRDEIGGFLKQIVHLGPIRPDPQRRYSFSRANADEWQARDWTAFRDFIGGKLGGAQTQEINNWLKRLDLAQGGSEPRLASENGSLFTEFEVAIREREKADPLPLSAMGYGLSQVLPVIVQCIAARPGSLVIVEQPELHLHPRAQAELGDLFIAMTHRGMHCLIETHSEHLLLRLRRRIAESLSGRASESDPTQLEADSLRAYFVDRVDGKSYLEAIKIDSQGKMTSPPGFRGFFADDLQELALLNKAILDVHTGEIGK